MHKYSSIIFGTGCWFVLMVGAVGCDNAIEPLSETSGDVFAINGFLDSEADTQFVRVSGLRPIILADEPDVSDVRVSSIDSETATVIEWRDSLVVLDDGSTGHLFFALFKPTPGNEYTFRVERSGGRRATATTRIPMSPDVLVSAPEGDSLTLSQFILLRGVGSPPSDLQMHYRVVEPDSEMARDIIIGYGQTGQVSASGWRFEVFLKRDVNTILRTLGLLPSDTTVRLKRIGVRLSIPSREWADIASPQNLEMAHGFFGSVGRYSISWTLDPLSTKIIGFVDEQNEK